MSHSTEEKTPREAVTLQRSHSPGVQGLCPWPHPCPSPVAHENRQRRPVLPGIHQESMCSRTLKHDDQGDTIERWWHDFTTTLIRVDSAEEGGMRKGHGFRDEAEGGEGGGKRG